MDFILKGITQGLIWALLALGVYLAFRILDFADMSCEGSFALGGAVVSKMLTAGIHPILGLLVAFLSGCLAGVVTGILHTKLKVPAILSGILTMTALFSVNLHIMGAANLQLNSVETLYDSLKGLLGWTKTNVSLLLGAVVCLLVMLALYWFFGTELGSGIRATGVNEKMCRAQGIDTDLTKIIGLALANGLIALSGAFLCQYQGYANITMGVGAIVIGLASIIIGEAIFARSKNFFLTLTGIVTGALLYRVVVAFVLYLNMPAEDVKLMTAVVVVAALCITRFGTRFKKKPGKQKKSEGTAGKEGEEHV